MHAHKSLKSLNLQLISLNIFWKIIFKLKGWRESYIYLYIAG